MNDTTFIYALCDPDTEEIRYVGKANDPGARLQRHCSISGHSEKTRKVAWIRELSGRGKHPKVKILLEVPFFEWQYWERAFIARFRDSGCELVNADVGGCGRVGKPPLTPTAPLWRRVNQLLCDLCGGAYPPERLDWQYISLAKIAKLLELRPEFKTLFIRKA